MQALLSARTRFDPIEPRIHISERRIDLLANAAAKIERAIQNDVGDGEAIARDIFLARELPVEPFELVLHNLFQAGRRLGQNAHPRLEELSACRISKAVVEMLGD